HEHTTTHASVASGPDCFQPQAGRRRKAVRLYGSRFVRCWRGRAGLLLGQWRLLRASIAKDRNTLSPDLYRWAAVADPRATHQSLADLSTASGADFAV